MQGGKGEREASKRKGPFEDVGPVFKRLAHRWEGAGGQRNLFRRAERELRPDLAAPEGRAADFQGARAVEELGVALPAPFCGPRGEVEPPASGTKGLSLCPTSAMP